MLLIQVRRWRREGKERKREDTKLILAVVLADTGAKKEERWERRKS
jgi:hypothetical protein